MPPGRFCEQVHLECHIRRDAIPERMSRYFIADIARSKPIADLAGPGDEPGTHLFQDLNAPRSFSAKPKGSEFASARTAESSRFSASSARARSSACL
jgi:hypothetical protein